MGPSVSLNLTVGLLVHIVTAPNTPIQLVGAVSSAVHHHELQLFPPVLCLSSVVAPAHSSTSRLAPYKTRRNPPAARTCGPTSQPLPSRIQPTANTASRDKYIQRLHPAVLSDATRGNDFESDRLSPMAEAASSSDCYCGSLLRFVYDMCWVSNFYYDMYVENLQIWQKYSTFYFYWKPWQASPVGDAVDRRSIIMTSSLDYPPLLFFTYLNKIEETPQKLTPGSYYGYLPKNCRLGPGWWQVKGNRR